MTTVLRRLARWAVYGLPYLVLTLLRIRFVSLTHPDRIGHLCVETDCLIKEGRLGLRPRFFPVLLLPRNAAANATLLSYWSRHLAIVQSSFWCRILGRMASLRGMSYPTAPYAVAIDETARYPGIYAAWGDREPLLSLNAEDLARGKAELARLGLPEGAWFICVHSREGGYSPADEHLHAYRNSDIDSYRLAMEAVVERGGWCIRVGEESSKPLHPMKNVIDYAHSGIKSDWMDVFLCASCRMFLGNSSGLFFVAKVFGRPCALANLTPMSCVPSGGPGDLSIPKMIRSLGTGDLLPIAEILRTPTGNFRFAAQYESDGIAVQANSPEDIRDLALEMLERVAGNALYTGADEALQARFHSLLKPGHYSHGAASRVGRDFLRKYASLLD